MPEEQAIGVLRDYLSRIPAVQRNIASGYFEDGRWWVKFGIDIDHHLAWNVVQELGQVLNYLSIHERLPTVFMPVSPPSYLNGGPRIFLAWVIESKDKDFGPDICAKWLEGRLPRPVDDLTQWNTEEDG